MVLLETKALKILRWKILKSSNLAKEEKENFLRFIWYLTKDERETLSLLI